MKNIIQKSLALLLVALLCFATVACSLTGKTPPENTDDSTTDDQTSTDVTGKTATTFVGIDINPSLEMTVSEDGTVISVYGSNEDGKILLYEEEAKIVGKNIEDAVAYVTELATELGYLNENNPSVSTLVTAGTDEAGAALKEKIDAKIVSSANALGLAVTVDAETAWSLLCELKDLQAANPDNDAIQNLTPEKYRLAISAANGGDITIEAAAELSNEQLIAEINSAHATLEAYATEAYLAAKARAMAIWQSSTGVLTDGIYTQIYTSRAASLLTNPAQIATIHYGAMYQAYQTSARTYLAVLDLMTFANEYTSCELDAETVTALSTALGLSDTAALKNEDGKITLGSLIAFCEDYMKTHEVSDAVQAQVREILAEAKDAAELVVMASDAYETELTALKNAVQGVVTTVTTASSAVLPLLPADAKAEFETCLSDLRATAEKIAVIMESGDTSDAVRQLAEEAQKKADEVEAKIKLDLSADELATAEQMRETLTEQINALTKAFEDRLTAAENAAKQFLREARDARKTKQ